jgi:membrane protease YdiL (CAAX protease family)
MSKRSNARTNLLAGLLALTLFSGLVAIPTMILPALLNHGPGDLGLFRAHVFYWAFCIALAAGIAVFCKRVDSPGRSVLFGLWKVSAKYYVAGIAVAVMVRAAQIAVAAVRGPLAGYVSPADEMLLEVGAGLFGAAITLIYVGVAIPVIEELIFRRVIYVLLQRFAPWLFVVVSAIAFAVVHPPGLQGWAFLIGIATAFLYARSSSLLPAIACHVAYNISGIIIGIAAAR